MADQHSPLPWRLIVGEIVDADSRILAGAVIDDEPVIVPGMVDREFIVRAVNSHYDLLAALKRLRHGDADCWCDFALGNPMYRVHSAKCAAAKAAIAKAEGVTAHV